MSRYRRFKKTARHILKNLWQTVFPFISRKAYTQLFNAATSAEIRWMGEKDRLLAQLDDSEFQKMEMQRRLAALFQGIPEAKYRTATGETLRRVLRRLERSTPSVVLYHPTAFLFEPKLDAVKVSDRVTIQMRRFSMEFGLAPDTPPEFVAEEIGEGIKQLILKTYRDQSVLVK